MDVGESKPSRFTRRIFCSMVIRGPGDGGWDGDVEYGELTFTKDDSRPADLRVIPSRELSNLATGTGIERGESGLSVALSAMLGRPFGIETDFFDCVCCSSFEKTLVTVAPTFGVSHTGGALLVSDVPREARKLVVEDLMPKSFRNDCALVLGASLLNLRLPLLFLFRLDSKSAILVFSIALSAFHSFRSFWNISRSLSKLSL